MEIAVPRYPLGLTTLVKILVTPESTIPALAALPFPPSRQIRHRTCLENRALMKKDVGGKMASMGMGTSEGVS